MGFTVSSLTDYVNQQNTELLTALQFAGETADLANVQTGIKSAEALQILTNSPVPQDGTNCGFNASGDSAFTQRVITTAPVKYQDSLCPRALEAKWTQLLLKKGQHYTEADIPGKILEDVKLQIIRRNEVMDWQGDTAAISSFLNRYDGLIKIIKAATGTTTATASTWNATNARAIVKNIISNIPAAQKGDPSTVIIMGYDAAETYRQALMDANLYHVPSGKDQKDLYAEGSVHKIIPVHGLDGLTGNTGDNPFIFALDPSRNLYLGVDMEDEEEDARVWVDGSDGETVKYSFRFRRGWQIAFPAEIVEYSNS